LPVQPAYSPKDDIKTTEAHRLVFPGANENMEFMRIDETLPKEQWKRGWEKFFDELQDEDGTATIPKPLPEEPERGFFDAYQSVKMQNNGVRIASIEADAVLPGTSEKQPFLATGTWGKGRVAWLASGEMWRLRKYKDAYHERFWTKFLRE